MPLSFLTTPVNGKLIDREKTDETKCHDAVQLQGNDPTESIPFGWHSLWSAASRSGRPYHATKPSCLWPHSGFPFPVTSGSELYRSHLEAMRALHTSANDGTGRNWPPEDDIRGASQPLAKPLATSIACSQEPRKTTHNSRLLVSKNQKRATVLSRCFSAHERAAVLDAGRPRTRPGYCHLNIYVLDKRVYTDKIVRSVSGSFILASLVSGSLPRNS
jgi:hypothetical protein